MLNEALNVLPGGLNPGNRGTLFFATPNAERGFALATMEKIMLKFLLFR